MKTQLYQQRLHDYYKDLRFRGQLLNPDFQSGTYNPSCGDAILFQGTIKNNCIESLKFEGKGCVISIATASMLSELVMNKEISAIQALSTQDILDLIAIELGPTRLRCALLSLEALHGGINNYLKQDK